MEKIAVLGWGSLIWEPGDLCYDGRWYKDGPLLPVEFARISRDGRLTLVLCPGAKEIPVLWTYSEKRCLEDAVENLMAREGTKDSRIGFVDLNNDKSRCATTPTVVETIKTWALKKKFDAVIWTDLPSNFAEKRKGRQFSEANVVEYLSELLDEKEKSLRAEEYIMNAPSQIATGLRIPLEVLLMKRASYGKSRDVLEIDELANSMDYLDMAVSSLIEAERNPYAWKWAVIAVHGALYGFAVCAVMGTDYERVTKRSGHGPKLKSFPDILQMCQSETAMKRFVNSRTLSLTLEQEKAIEYLHKDLRNRIEHFIPTQWSIELSSLPKVVMLCLEVIEFLALESGNILFSENMRERIESLCRSGKGLALSSGINRKNAESGM